ncbi:sirtuin [Artomyces pyxidatus]|uniref:Sirtuin n=1 Tax=Artomyces pyxidatus TaxID=48021 RepID=A0ACB8T6A6_9AGAM|nr:sirtuin [Artomyces pyxidatus]
MSSTPSSDVAAFRAALASSKNIIVLAGAGLSAGSGIKTFRGAGGFWHQHDIQAVASTEGFNEHPSLVWQFYYERREECVLLEAKPNRAHHALASLSDPLVIARVAPSLEAVNSPPLLITQNIDSLSQRALGDFPEEVRKAAEERILEMHGSILTTRCTSCQHIHRSSPSNPSPLAAALAKRDGSDIPLAELPRCGGDGWAGSNRYGRCGGLLRPNVIWFGEVPEHMGEIARKLNWCDMLLVVGTSSLVHPAAGFAANVKKRGGKVAVFNLERSRGDEDADFLFLGPCEETLPQVLGV